MLLNDPAGSSQGDSHLLHPGSRLLFRIWENLRAGDPLLPRDRLDLQKFRPLIASLFIIERAAGPSPFRWRLAGTGLTDLFRKDLTGRSVLEGWDRFERNILERFLNGVAEELQPCVLRFRLHTDRNQLIGAEMIAVPMAARHGGTHILGGLHPFRDLHGLGHGGITRMELSGARGVWSEHVGVEPLAQAVGSARSATGFRPFHVITGGRTD